MWGWGGHTRIASAFACTSLNKKLYRADLRKEIYHMINIDDKQDNVADKHT